MSADRPERPDEPDGPDGSDARLISDLETRLSNYRRTRRLSARSMHEWCDLLIEDAESQLRRLRERYCDRPDQPGDDTKCTS